ncbi:hypothetical protein UK82_04115 [Frankia sp. ACN1ag]|nr:hypothetical protein UK82_04115 [Frankia sp. ACN1ag]
MDQQDRRPGRIGRAHQQAALQRRQTVEGVRFVVSVRLAAQRARRVEGQMSGDPGGLDGESAGAVPGGA